MRWKSTTAVIGIVGMAAAVAHAQNAATKLLAGDTKVEVVASYQGDPLPKPDKILICDFAVSPDVITTDQSAAAQIRRRRLQRRGSDADSSPGVVARQVQAGFSRTLASELQKTAMPAEISSAEDAVPPMHALIVRGEFVAINEGNKTKRVMIGFGRGASDVQAHIMVSLLTQGVPVILSEFNLKSVSGKKPGAVTTMGVGSVAVGAAAGGAGDKKATVEADASRMAKAVAKQIEEVMVSQKWIPAPQPDNK